MGAIYSSAVFTIVIACEGDLTTGLPGVSRKRNSITNYENLGSFVLLSHQTDAITEIQLSKWATRAWTYQEGYLSKRRLFFANNQVVFICNDQIRLEISNEYDTDEMRLRSLRKMFPYHGKILDSPDALDIALKMLEEFTARSLSYQSDALDAITGAQNTLNSQTYPVYHFWGLPFLSHIKTSGYLAFTVTFNWYHSKPINRRPGFPSWSPLGWQGPVVFFYYNQQPKVRSKCVIPVCHDGISRDLGSWAEYQVSVSSPSSAPQCLQLTAPMVHLSLYYTTGQSGPLVVFPWLKVGRKPESLMAYVEAAWDSEPQSPHKEQDSITCLFSTKGSRYWNHYKSRVIGLLLKNHGSYYERVGCLVYPRKKDGGWTSPKERGPFWDSKVYTRDPDGSLNSTDQPETRLEKHNKYYPTWLTMIRIETILLG
jgi:hypothetical protein